MKRLSWVVLELLFVAAVADAQMPPAPTNLVAARVGISEVLAVQLTWERPTGIELFKVYQSFGDTSSFSNIDQVRDTFYVDFTAFMTGTFFYYVTSVDSQFQESNRSNIASITIGGAPGRPSAPTNLVAQLQPPGMPLVRLDWDSSGYVDYFRIFRAVNDSSDFDLYALSPSTTFFDENLAHGTRNFYFVTAVVDSEGVTLESDPSNVASVARMGGAFGTVSGTILDDSTSAPIAGISMKFFLADNPTAIVHSTTTNPLGQYSATLDTGVYKIFAESLPPFPGIPPQYLS
jgi:fibronectin type 3 domain-containing protein